MRYACKCVYSSCLRLFACNHRVCTTKVSVAWCFLSFSAFITILVRRAHHATTLRLFTYLQRVKHLMLILLRQLLDRPCHLKQPVSESALPVINMRDDTEVSNELGVECLKQLLVYLYC